LIFIESFWARRFRKYKLRKKREQLGKRGQKTEFEGLFGNFAIKCKEKGA